MLRVRPKMIIAPHALAEPCRRSARPGRSPCWPRALGSKLLLTGERSLSLFFGVLVMSMHHRWPTPFLCSGSWPTPMYSLFSQTTGVRYEVVARALGAELVHGVLGIAVELPEQLAVRGVEGAKPAVAAGEDDLRLAVRPRRRPGWTTGRASALAVVDQLLDVDFWRRPCAPATSACAGSVVLPQDLAGPSCRGP